MNKVDTVELKLPGRPEYMSLIRLTTSGIGQQAGLSIDDIEDLKLAISEVCINIIEENEDTCLDIKYSKENDKLVISIKDLTRQVALDVENSEERKLGLLIIESLMDEVLFVEEGVRIIKYIE